MRIWIIRTKRDVIVFALVVTIFCMAIAALTTSFVFNVVQPKTHLAYVINAALITAFIAPILASILAANVLYIQKMRTQLAEQAHADPLTGLMNRRAFRETVQREQRRMERLGTKCGLILIDLDHFKHINDVHGHTAGDMVLQAVADVLKLNVRPSMDHVARWGGEEFVLLVTGTAIDGATAAAERLRSSIETLDPSIGKICLGVTASFGVAQLHVGQTLDDALDHADRCLYEAKETGRNKVVSAKSDGLRVVA